MPDDSDENDEDEYAGCNEKDHDPMTSKEEKILKTTSTRKKSIATRSQPVKVGGKETVVKLWNEP